jgi:hypothetical protein
MRQLLVAAVGVLVSAASAPAQFPIPVPDPGAPVAYRPARVGPYFPETGSYPNGRGHVVDGGYFTRTAAFGYLDSNNAAGSVISDHAFMFGSTRSFFAPCGPYIGSACKLCVRKQPASAAAPKCDTRCEIETILK